MNPTRLLNGKIHNNVPLMVTGANVLDMYHDRFERDDL